MAGSIASGERLKDRYRLERLLGRGGMAAVWLGHDERLERPVAVKVLADTIASDPGFVVRFRREARTAAGLTHPNLVRVYDFSDQGERPYLVMQYLPGEDLSARLERGAPVDGDALARQLLGALAHIHAAGILHRDVKPANVVVEPDGTAKLIDFGIALPPDATSLTRTGLVLGTERYTAPEVMEGHPASERSDLYSCGVVLRRCGGQRSRALGILVGAMTSEDPRERPLSAAAALAQLERVQAPVKLEQPTQAFEPAFAESTEPLPRTDPPDPPVPSRSHGRGLAVVAALGLLALAVAVVVLALGGGDDEPARDRAAPQANANDGNRQAQADATEPEPAPSPQPSGEDPARGAALNEQGYALIGAGDYAAAVPLLEEAVASFPAGTTDLDYAYALYNLGNALRLSGRPGEAVPILEQRLEIPDQRVAVREELRAARAEAG